MRATGKTCPHLRVMALDSPSPIAVRILCSAPNSMIFSYKCEIQIASEHGYTSEEQNLRVWCLRVESHMLEGMQWVALGW